MKTVGLFSGIGGFELGFHQAGHDATLLCDVLPAAKAVLTTRFPGVGYADDIKKLKSLPSGTDVVCAGFPCQDLSQAGKTKGLAGDRSGLVSEVFRLIRKARVPTVVIENVPFMLQLNGGLAIRSIISDLEELGYRWAYRVVDSFSFGLPQRRERVFIVASKVLDPAQVLLADDFPVVRPASAIGQRAHGFYWTEGLGGLGWAVDSVPTLKNGSTVGIPSPPAILMPDYRVITPHIHDAERLQGFGAVDGEHWTLPAESVARPSARWGLVGSAVSVPVAKWIGTRLSNPGQYDPLRDRPFPSVGKAPRAARSDGKQRFAVSISADAGGVQPVALATFLSHSGSDLSTRAAVGFLSRTRRARLRFQPGFIEAIERHVIQSGGEIPPRQQRSLPLLEAA
jgi:DNA (cytosine-5)-methyltransferase 1